MQGADEGTACKNFWIVDAKGLITDQRPALSDVVQPFARSTVDSADVDREKLLEVIKRVPLLPPQCPGCCLTQAGSAYKART